MAGTVEGGRKAAARNKAKFGPDFYAQIGRKGGERGRTGGFWHKKHIEYDDEFIKEAGRKGGAISKRGKKKVA